MSGEWKANCSELRSVTVRIEGLLGQLMREVSTGELVREREERHRVPQI